MNWTPSSELDDCIECQQTRAAEIEELARLGFSAPYFLGRPDESEEAVDCLRCGAMVRFGENVDLHARMH